MTDTVAYNRLKLENQKFGRLTVIKFSHISKKGARAQRAFWECKCDCGKIVCKNGYSLKNGDVKSCGCINRERLIAQNRVFLAGKIFGRLFVVGASNTICENGQTMWICTCTCGNEVLTPTFYLTHGAKKSCGCLKIDRDHRKGYGNSSKTKLFYSYRRCADKRNIKFNLSFGDFENVTQGNCFYCGIAPKQIFKVKNGFGDYTYNGIDRVDNNIGYTLENCVPCCAQCNRGKMAYSKEDFLSWVNRIYNNKFKLTIDDFQI